MLCLYSVTRLPTQNESTNPQTLAYYQQVWGFNPASGRIQLKKGWSRYEEFYPLGNDADFHQMGVEIGARVDWKDERISNSIIFRCQVQEARVECTHAVIYQGQREEVLDRANDPLSIPDAESMLSPAQLSPEEHFVALKSYVAGIAEIGIAQLFRASYFSSEYDPASAVVGFNSLMQKQVAEALVKIATVPARNLLQTFLIDLMTHAPPAWVEQRLPYLDVTYNISNLIFHDEKVLVLVKGQFPALPWDKWAEIVRIKWNDLKEWAEWFSRIESIPTKLDFNYGLPHIGVDYPAFAKLIRESPVDELIDKFLMDPSFSESCRKVFHVVIEEENWGGASSHNKRDLGFLTIQVLGSFFCLFFCLRVGGQNIPAIILGLSCWFIFMFLSAFWQKYYDNRHSSPKIMS